MTRVQSVYDILMEFLKEDFWAGVNKHEIRSIVMAYARRIIKEADDTREKYLIERNSMVDREDILMFLAVTVTAVCFVGILLLI